MSEKHAPTAHADVVKRLKRANGHLLTVIAMMEAQRPCIDIAQQLHAVERALGNAKNRVIHDHLDQCLEAVANAGPAARRSSIAQFKDITKYL